MEDLRKEAKREIMREELARELERWQQKGVHIFG